MHFCSLYDLIDHLLFGSKCQSYQFRIVWAELGEHLPVGGVVRSRANTIRPLMHHAASITGSLAEHPDGEFR